MPMTEKRIFRLAHDEARRRAVECILQAPEGYVGRVLEWAIAVCDAANKLANGQARQPEIAYKRLEAAVNHE